MQQKVIWISFFGIGISCLLLFFSSCQADVETDQPKCFPEKYTVEFENLLSSTVRISLLYEDGYLDSVAINPNSAKSKVFDFNSYGIVMDIGSGEGTNVVEIEFSSESGLIRTDPIIEHHLNRSPYHMESYYGGKEAEENIKNSKKCSETFTLVFPIDSCYFDYSCPEIN